MSDKSPRLTINAKDRANLLRMWQAVAELRQKASDIEGQLNEALGLDDPGHVVEALGEGASTVAEFDRALAADGVVVV